MLSSSSEFTWKEKGIQFVVRQPAVEWRLFFPDEENFLGLSSGKIASICIQCRTHARNSRDRRWLTGPTLRGQRKFTPRKSPLTTTPDLEANELSMLNPCP